jgi:hypothetical protein
VQPYGTTGIKKFGSVRMPSPILFSTNPLMKFEIQRDYYGHEHYVWCADCYDGRHHLLHLGSRLPPSSNPAELLTNLRAATIERPDSHDRSIAYWKQSLKERAIKDALAGRLDAKAEQEIIFLIDRADIGKWRPLLYVISRAAVEARLEEVPMAERASPEMEYRIRDLRMPEFDVVAF